MSGISRIGAQIFNTGAAVTGDLPTNRRGQGPITLPLATGHAAVLSTASRSTGSAVARTATAAGATKVVAACGSTVANPAVNTAAPKTASRPRSISLSNA